MKDSDKTREELIRELEGLRAEQSAWQASKSAQETLRAVLQASFDLMIVLDAEGRYRAVFTTQDDLAVAPANELLGKTIYEVVDPEAAKEIQKTIDVALATEQIQNLGCRLEINGTQKWLSGRMLRFSYEGSNCLLWSARDITAQRQAEEVLRESERRFGIIAGQSLFGISILQNGKYVFMNEAAEKIIELSHKEVFAWKPEHFLQLIHPEDLSTVAREVRKKTEQGFSGVSHYQYRIITKSGSIKWIENYSKAIDYGGEIADLILIADITNRKLAEIALKENEEKYRILFERMLNASALQRIICDERGRPVDCEFIEVNPAFERVTGFKREEIIGRRVTDLMPSVRQSSFDWIGVCGRVAQTGETARFERYFEPNEKWYAVAAYRPFKDHFVVVFEDISYRKTAEIEKEQLQEQLIQSQKMEAVGTLAGGIAHDMNNVLAVVLGLASILVHGMDPGDSKIHDLKEIISAARRGKNLVENLLGFARKGDYRRQPVSANEMVRTLLNVLGHCLPKTVVLNTDLDANPVDVECDRSQILQALINICINASDALDGRGAIAITTRKQGLGTGDVTGLGAGSYVRIQVEDNGPGMNGETCRKAFEPFFTTKDVGKGTGLGLSMAYGVVKNHGGVIQIDSTVGKGTTVSIWLPAIKREAAQEGQEAREAPKPPLEKRKARVLLVDDEEMFRETGKRMLSLAGYDVIVADGGASALDTYRNNAHDIDLVLLDLSMPVIDGAECFQRLKEIDEGVQVIICTGHGHPKDTEGMIANGALSVLRKPFDFMEMSEVLTEAMSDFSAEAMNNCSQESDVCDASDGQQKGQTNPLR